MPNPPAVGFSNGVNKHRRADDSGRPSRPAMQNSRLAIVSGDRRKRPRAGQLAEV
jgi:hypothetical protein